HDQPPADRGRLGTVRARATRGPTPLRRPLGLRRPLAAPPSLARLLDAGPQHLHEVDDLGGLLLGLPDRDLLALGLALDQVEDAFSIGVLELLGLPGLRQVL